MNSYEPVAAVWIAVALGSLGVSVWATRFAFVHRRWVGLLLGLPALALALFAAWVGLGLWRHA